MSEDRVPCDARSDHIEPKSVSKEEIQKAERAQAVQLEIHGVTLPDKGGIHERVHLVKVFVTIVLQQNWQ